MLYKDEKGTYVLRHSFTTKSGKKIVSKNGKPFKIYMSNNKQILTLKLFQCNIQVFIIKSLEIFIAWIFITQDV